MSGEKKVGVIGSGSFGSVIANIISHNESVLIYSRKASTIEAINDKRFWKNVHFSNNVTATDDLSRVAAECDVIFPTVPSSSFKSMITDFAPFLKPYHILIHGTKGFELKNFDKNSLIGSEAINAHDIQTMSEIILQNTCVKKVGCISGPNLAKEMANGLPAGTVVASKFNEVIHAGKTALKSPKFMVYGSYDIRGTELSGVLKNVLAIAAGASEELQLGVNARSLLIARGVGEIIRIGKVLGANAEAFLGLAGIGDIIATCSSSTSRNFKVGQLLAQGKNLQEVLASLDETAEGIATTRIVNAISQRYDLRTPIFNGLNEILNNRTSVPQALEMLMRYPFQFDVDFI